MTRSLENVSRRGFLKTAGVTSGLIIAAPMLSNPIIAAAKGDQ